MDPVIFLDRDGVISEELGNGEYISRWEQFRFIAGALEAIRLFTERKLDLFIVSNQGGVGRGLVSQKELEKVTERMLEEINKNGGKIQGVYYCVHHPEGTCLCRKPGTALFERAAERKKILWRKSVVVGDALRDLDAGRQLGCQTVLVLSGRTQREETADWPFQPDHVAGSLIAAAPWILKWIRQE